jgi:hypothetical protein
MAGFIAALQIQILQFAQLKPAILPFCNPAIS